MSKAYIPGGGSSKAYESVEGGQSIKNVAILSVHTLRMAPLHKSESSSFYDI